MIQLAIISITAKLTRVCPPKVLFHDAAALDYRLETGRDNVILNFYISEVALSLVADVAKEVWQPFVEVGIERGTKFEERLVG